MQIISAIPWLGIIVVTVGLTCSAYYLSLLYWGNASMMWELARGTVVFSEVKRRYFMNFTEEYAYEPNIVYCYNVGPQEYQCDVISYTPVILGHGGKAHEFVRRYPRGRTVDVYYNPQNPCRAVIEPGISPLIWAPIAVGGMVTVFGIAAFF